MINPVQVPVNREFMSLTILILFSYVGCTGDATERCISSGIFGLKSNLELVHAYVIPK